MMTKLKLIILILLFCLYGVEVGFACQLTINGDQEKPPKIWLEDGEPRGILVDMMKYIGKEVDCDFQIKLYPWKRAYCNAVNGKGGIIGLSLTPERLQVFDYSEVMYVDELILVVQKGREFPFAKIEDLRGKTIGVNRGAKYGSDFVKGIERGIFTISEDSNPVSRFKKLLLGRTDVLIIGPGRAGFDAIIKSDPELLRKRDQFVILPKPFSRDPNYLGIAKKLHKKLFLQRFNQAIKKGRSSGAFEKIIEKYSK